MPNWKDAVQPQPGGARLMLEVTAGARDARFPSGYNPWRNRLGIRVRAQARKGEANAEVLGTVAAFFGLGPGAATLVSGHLDSRKDVAVAGIDAEAARDQLAAALETA